MSSVPMLPPICPGSGLPGDNRCPACGTVQEIRSDGYFVDHGWTQRPEVTVEVDVDFLAELLQLHRMAEPHADGRMRRQPYHVAVSQARARERDRRLAEGITPG